jgi:hypothetical protein
MITKTQLMEALTGLPEEFSIETLVLNIKEIIVAQQNAGEMTEDELDADIEKWYE